MNTVNVRVQKHRDALRRSGLRPVQIWVPDTRSPEFASECQRQAQLVCMADTADVGVHDWLDKAPLEIEGWTA